MYAGHFAAGLAIKAKEPRAPTWAVLIGIAFLDILFGAFILTGIEKARITPGTSPGFFLDFIDWSHSLAMSIVWAVVFALAFAKRGRAVAVACGIAVFSHFLLDLPMHPGDLALWPHSEAHTGFGLWTTAPPLWWFVELAFIGVCSAYYLVRAQKVGTFGGRGALACAVVVVLHVVNSPWLAPA